MPVLGSRETRSRLAAESPPRKRFKFSLKLKPRKKGKTKNPMDSDSENENGAEKYENAAEFSCRNPATNGLSMAKIFGLENESVTPPLPYSGLANLGNTCYLNAVVQVLRYCPGFLKSLVNLDELSCPSDDLANKCASVSESDEDSLLSTRPSIIHSVHKLSNEMKNAEENYSIFGLEAKEVKKRSGWTTLAVRPQDFVKDFSGLCPPFAGYQQHDAQEFLRSFLGLVEEECAGLGKGEQQDNLKGNISVANNGSKVRGGCKYPSTVTSNVIETKGESTKTMLAEGSAKMQPSSDVDWSETGSPANSYTNTPKSAPKIGASCSDNGNIVKHLFEGTLLLQTCCLNCEGIRQRYESFQDISVPVQNTTKTDTSEDTFGSNLSDSEDDTEHDLNLSWAISKFASVERLSGDNKYFCDNCATLTEADISTYFEKLPQVLTIHLKRFQTSYGNQNLFSNSWVTKVTKSLHTPQRLSLKKWCSKTCSEENAVYSLFGVVMHNGMSSCSGHYLSYVNVDVLKKQVDREKVMEDSGCTSSVQCEKVGNRNDEVMDVDDGYGKIGNDTGLACNGEFISKITGHDQKVKCDLCQGKATEVNGMTCRCMTDSNKGGISDAHGSSSLTHGDTPTVCDEESKCQTQSKVEASSVPSQEEDDGDLSCTEGLAMDMDDEDTCDYSEFVKDCASPTTEENMTDSQDSTTVHRVKSENEVDSKQKAFSWCSRDDTSTNGKESASPVLEENTKATEDASTDSRLKSDTKICGKASLQDSSKDTVTNNSESVSRTVKDYMKSTRDSATDSRSKSGTKVYSKLSLRRETIENEHDSESSDEAEPATVNCGHIPRSMDITRYFKPMPKSGASSKKSCRDSEKPSEQDCTSECSSTPSNVNTDDGLVNEEGKQNVSRLQPTDSSNGSASKIGLDEPRSAFSAFAPSPVAFNMGSDGRLGSEENRKDALDSSSNIQRSKSCSPESSCQGRTSKVHPISGNKVDDAESVGQVVSDDKDSSCTQRNGVELGDGQAINEDQSCDSTSSMKLILDMEASDEVGMNDQEMCVASRGDSVDQESSGHSNPVAGANNLHTSTAEFSNSEASPMPCHHKADHVQPSNNNSATAAHRKGLQCEDTLDESHSDGTNTFSTWLKFDDAEVQEISAKDMEEILSPSTSCYSTPYLLFYYRC